MMHIRPEHLYVGQFDVTYLYTKDLTDEEQDSVELRLHCYLDSLVHAFPELDDFITADFDDPPDDVSSYAAFLASITFRVCANDPRLPI